MFIFWSLVLAVFGRQIGWWLSRRWLYFGPAPAAAMTTSSWAGVVAVAIRALIDWYQPGRWVTIIFGYLAGAYVAQPHFGLVVPSTIPPDKQGRHVMITMLSLLAYVGTSVGLWWWSRGR